MRYQRAPCALAVSPVAGQSPVARCQVRCARDGVAAAPRARWPMADGARHTRASPRLMIRTRQPEDLVPTGRSAAIPAPKRNCTDPVSLLYRPLPTTKQWFTILRPWLWGLGALAALKPQKTQKRPKALFGLDFAHRAQLRRYVGSHTNFYEVRGIFEILICAARSPHAPPPY